MFFKMLFEFVILLATSKIRNVGRNQRIFLRQQLGGFNHASGSDGSIMKIYILIF